MSDINEIKQALTKITQGHWVHYSGRLRKDFPTKINEVQTSSGETVVPWTGFDACSVAKKEITHNAKFIANAPTWISSLITTIESLQKEIDKQHDTFYNEVRFSGQQLEAQKAITELAVKGLVFYAEHVDWEDNSMGDKARDTLSEIERLQNGTT